MVRGVRERSRAKTRQTNSRGRKPRIELRSMQSAKIEPLDARSAGRVETWRGGGVAPFPRSAHRTGRAVFPHPALGEGIMFQPTGTALCVD